MNVSSDLAEKIIQYILREIIYFYNHKIVVYTHLVRQIVINFRFSLHIFKEIARDIFFRLVDTCHVTNTLWIAR